MHQPNHRRQLVAALVALLATGIAGANECFKPIIEVAPGAPVRNEVSVESFTFSEESERYTFDQATGRANGTIFTPPSADVTIRIQGPAGNCTYTLKDDDGMLLLSTAYMTVRERFRAEYRPPSMDDIQSFAPKVTLPPGTREAFFRASMIMDRARPPKGQEELQPRYDQLRQRFRESLSPISNARRDRVSALEFEQLSDPLAQQVLEHSYEGTRQCDGKAPEPAAIELQEIVSGVPANFQFTPDDPNAGEGITLPSRCNNAARERIRVQNLQPRFGESRFEFVTRRNDSGTSTAPSADRR